MDSVWPPSVEYVRIYKGRSGKQDKIQAVLIFATKLNFIERATQSDHQHCQAGERGSRWAPGFTGHGRQGSQWQRGRKAYPDRIGGEVAARGTVGVRG